MKKIIILVLTGLLLMLSCTVFAEFRDIGHAFPKDRSKNINWTVTADDNGTKIDMTYLRQGKTAQFIVKRKGKEIFRECVPVSYLVGIHQIQNDTDGRNFFLLGLSDSEALLMGYDPQSGKWQKYINVNDFYDPLNSSFIGISVKYGELYIIQSNGLQSHRYRLFWNSFKNWFGYDDLGTRLNKNW